MEPGESSHRTGHVREGRRGRGQEAGPETLGVGRWVLGVPRPEVLEP